MINYNDDNDQNFYPQSQEDRIIYEAKVAAFKAMQCWIENVTSQKFSHDGDFRRSLSDGTLLCNLLNCLKPGSVKRINRISTPIAGYDNIGKFLRICEEDFGLGNVILFETSDLEDLSDRPIDMTMESDRRLQRVLICLFHLAKSVENQLTAVTLDQKPFKILLQSQDHREMRRLKSNSISSDSNHEIQLSKLLHNKNPDYLATRAYETLSRTKANQDNLHRSSNDEEWQESLENWKEKRRQVISNSSIEENKDERNIDNQELLELKERARKMKLLRDQLKDQSIVTEPPVVDHVDNRDSNIIPNIDEETMAMIERVKQKKLAEENKRKFNISPQLSAAFASDSEQSTSTAVDKHDDDTQSISERIEVCEPVALTPEMPPSNISANNVANSYPCEVGDEPDQIEDLKTRLVNIKLTNRSKQDRGQLWGMEVTGGVGGVIVSKVKIGSCADVCDVRKGDKLMSINSEDVSRKSVEYIQSMFGKFDSMGPGSDVVNLSLRRIVNDDEDAEFYSSDQSEDKENILSHSNPISHSDELHRHNINYDITDLELVETPDQTDYGLFVTDENLFPSNVIATSILPDKFQQSQLLVESCVSHQDESSCHIVYNPLLTKPEVTNTQSESDFGVETPCQLSVQDKVTKIESQNACNTMRLSYSWNVPKTSSNDPLFSKSNMGQSIDRLCWNSDNFKYRQFGSGNSSLSNLYHYWETEAPKSVSSSQVNKYTKSAPVIQAPISSTIADREKSTDIDMEIAEQQMDTSNGNLEQTWRNVHSSGNSSTSDDVSALNETVILPQYKATVDSNEQCIDRTQNLGDERCCGDSVTKDSSSLAGYQVIKPVLGIISQPQSIVEREKVPLFQGNQPRTNTSTGIQADLIQCLKPTNYTNITTSFKSRHNKSNSYPSSQLSDDDTCSITLSNAQDYRLDNGPSSPESKESYCMNIPSMDLLNMNDISKDYTTITAVTQHNDNPRKFNACMSLSNESSITGVSDNNEKSVEIEVSVTPQLFPIRHKTLIQKPVRSKNGTSKSNDISTISNSSCTDGIELTLQSDYVKVTDLDDVISPVKEEPIYAMEVSRMMTEIKKDDRNVLNTISDPKNNTMQPYVKMRKKHSTLPNENGRPKSQQIVYPDNKSHSLRSSICTDQSMSTIPVPTLFKSGPKSENTLSQGQLSSRSDSGKSKKLESILSSKKLKKCYPGDSNLLSDSKRSSSTKELRFKEMPDDLANSDTNQRTLSFRNDEKPNSSSKTKYSIPETSHNQVIETLPITTNTKSHTKSYSIERSTTNSTLNSNIGKKAPKKPATANVNETKISMKCNYCAAFVGLEEDLMVIEELNLHFHLKCFICSECKRPLGDGKSDTDVRIRRSKLHCMSCYQKKSSKSKHRVNSIVDRTSQSTGNVSQNKGGNGDRLELHVHAGNSNNCAAVTTNNSNHHHLNSSLFPSIHQSLSQTTAAAGQSFKSPLPLHISYLDTF